MWMYQEIGFTKLPSLYELIVNCVDRSPMGYSAAEIGAVVHTRVANQMGVLTRGGRLRRARFTEGHVYFSLDPTHFHQQISLRRTQWHEAEPIEPEQALSVSRVPGGLSHDEIVLVLIEMIQHPRISLKALVQKLHDEQKCEISESALRELVDTYQLERYKKKNISC
jgi:hypothetical protein